MQFIRNYASTFLLVGLFTSKVFTADECVEDNDCGLHGKCVDGSGNSNPLECYCQLGWFGTRCEKEMAKKSIPAPLNQYAHRSLVKDVDLYWRLVHDEIEVILRATGESYVALGWRNKDTTADCKAIGGVSHDALLDSRRSKELLPQQTTSTSTNVSSSTELPSLSSIQEISTIATSETGDDGATTTRVRFPSRKLTTRTHTPSSVQSTSELTTTPPPIRTEISVSVGKRVEVSVNSTEKLPVSDEILTSREVTVEGGSLPLDSIAAIAPEEIEDGVEVKSYGADQQRKKRQVFRFHPMDCTDMVIGTVNGAVSRIRDYYSQSMAPPKPDGLWGGTEDLTAALGFEENGVTTILFRKKLLGKDTFDVNFVPDTMHVIWARGSVNETRGELQYHGASGTQRGVTEINFFDVPTTTSSGTCRGEWSRPSDCANDKCEYKATWEYSPSSDDIFFTVFTQHASLWTGIGFSRDRQMNNSDVVIGWVNDNGRHFIMDMWVNGYVAPLLDETQNIDNQAGQRNGSGTTLMFSRKWATNDSQDLAFDLGTCLYLLFPFHGGLYNAVNKKIKKHEVTPAVSYYPLCMHSCESLFPENDVTTVDYIFESTSTQRVAETTGDRLLEQTTTATANLLENVRKTDPIVVLKLRVVLAKLINLGANNQPALQNKIKQEVRHALQNVTSVRDIEVVDVERNDNWLIATMNVSMNEADLAETIKDIFMIEKIMNASVSSGSVGLLTVDESYLLVLPPAGLEATEKPVPDVHQVADVSRNSKLVALYAVIAAAIALGLLAITQIVCSLYRCYKVKNLHTSKERLISNSGWKDYSMSASSKYSYEPFASHDEEVNGKISKNPVGSGNAHKNGQMVPKDSRSLSRQPRGGQPPAETDRSHYARRSESLPRLGSGNVPPSGPGFGSSHEMPVRSTGTMPRTPVELQPDFYFMPSQRRYSGEVVRVYVDYDNPNFQAS